MRKNIGVRGDCEKISDGMRVDHEKERLGESSL